MPLVRIDVVRGRERERLAALMAEVTATVSRVLDTPADRVRVIVNEVDPDLWGIGGIPYSVVRGAPAGPGAEEGSRP